MNAKAIVLAIAIVAGIAILPAFFANMPSRIIEDDLLPLEDITKELDLCFFQRARSSFISCNRDEFSFSDSYGVIYAGWGESICQGGRRVEKISDVYFTFSGNTPGICKFRLTVQFEDGEIFVGGVLIEGGPRRDRTRYELMLANPGNNMPIAGIIYNHETEEVFYIVTKLTY